MPSAQSTLQSQNLRKFGNFRNWHAYCNNTGTARTGLKQVSE